MPTAVFDASLLTYRKQAKALYAFQAARSNAIQTATGGGFVVARPEYVLGTGDNFAIQKQGGCICSDDAAGAGINRQAPGACGCAR